MYSIKTDSRFRLVDIAMSGFFDAAGVASFIHDEQQAVARISASDGDHILLVDVTELRLQSQETVSHLLRLIGETQNMARKTALLVGASVFRMQAKRFVQPDRIEMFGTRSEALDWLLDRGQVRSLH